MRQSALITGASSGIGYATVKMLTEHGYHIFAGVRASADAARLVSDFGENATPLIFDITDHLGVTDAAREVASRLGELRLAGLVNNAGVAYAAPLLLQPIDEFRQQMEINVTAQLAVTQAFAPLLGSDRSRTGEPGRIVMMSSTGGKMISPFLGAYGASKHALEGLSDALRRELILYGIRVILIEPGVIATPIWDKAETRDRSAYLNSDYGPAVKRLIDYAVPRGRRGASPERVARAVLRALSAQNPPPRIPVIPNRLVEWTIARRLPDRWMDKAMTQFLGLKRLKE